MKLSNIIFCTLLTGLILKLLLKSKMFHYICNANENKAKMFIFNHQTCVFNVNILNTFDVYENLQSNSLLTPIIFELSLSN